MDGDANNDVDGDGIPQIKIVMMMTQLWAQHKTGFWMSIKMALVHQLYLHKQVVLHQLMENSNPLANNSMTVTTPVHPYIQALQKFGMTASIKIAMLQLSMTKMAMDSMLTRWTVMVTVLLRQAVT